MPSSDTQFKKGQRASIATEFKKGMPSANKGRHYKLSKEARKNISEGHKGEKAYQWKGDNVGYETLHKWVRKQLGKPTKCVKCKTKTAKRYVWANKSGEYKRDINDYEWTCRKCHMKEDGRVNKNLLKNVPNNVKRDSKGKFIPKRSKKAGGEEN